MLTAIIQARLGSTRLPNKVMADIAGLHMWEHVARRALQVAPCVVIATPDPLLAAKVRHPYDTFIGSIGTEHDVLARYYEAALVYGADPIIRLTADCPLTDVGVLQQLVAEFSTGKYDYVSVATGSPGGQFPHLTDASEQKCICRYPDGLDAEIFSLAALRRAWAEALLPHDREHVTPYIWDRPWHDGGNGGVFRVGHIYAPEEMGHLRWTVDTQDDLKYVRAVYAALGPDFGWRDVLNYHHRH